jgi:serine/threonine protein kinase
MKRKLKYTLGIMWLQAMLENGAVAIKRLSNTYMYEKEFFREVECLMKVKHQNIVRFLGYCVDTQGNMATYKGKLVMADIQQRLLCFEYLPNGGLDGYIKGRTMCNVNVPFHLYFLVLGLNY